MSIKCVNLILNNYCNGRCSICGIWKNKDKSNLDPSDIIALSKNKEFKHTEEISISGGEPTIIPCIDKIIESSIESFPNLKKLFLNHNATKPEMVYDLVRRFAGKVPEFYLCISIEGNKEINDLIRGIPVFDKAIKCLELCSTLKLENYHPIISTTLQKLNSGRKNLDYLFDLANNTKSDLTFRFLTESEAYYDNNGIEQALGIPDEQKIEVLNYLKNKGYCNEYSDILEEYYLKGTNSIMQNRDKDIICKAGELFVTVLPDKRIYPCIYSKTPIGTINQGLTSNDLRTLAPCPCTPTECTIYPMLNYSKKKD